MIYDKLPVTLLAALSAMGVDSPYAQIARHVLAHADEPGDISIKSLAEACHVGAGTVSRFARDMGFRDFAELRDEVSRSSRSFERVAGTTTAERSRQLARGITRSLGQVLASVDERALALLVDDLVAYEKVSAYGLLKAQAAATELQVGLLMQGKLVGTCATVAQQISRIETASSDELVVVFSYTGDYFSASDLGESLRRVNRPRIWMVCGAECPLPPFVYGRLAYRSDLGQLGHPYQLQFVAGIIAQEFAAKGA